jgi:hypothetical protein
MRDLVALVHADPRGRSEEEWHEVLNWLLVTLSGHTGSRVELGPYWMDVKATNAASASMGARVRAQGALLNIPSDSWEGALCLTGGAEGAYVDLIGFPFLGGSTLTPEGRLAELGDDPDVDEYWFHMSGGTWQTKGWHSEGYDEWSSIRAPGDACFVGVSCELESTLPQASPIICRATAGKDDQGRIAEVSVSVNLLRRDGATLISPPPASVIPRNGQPERRPAQLTSGGAEIDLRDLRIPGGWIRGTYEMELRWHFDRAEDSEADISNILNLTLS